MINNPEAEYAGHACPGRRKAVELMDVHGFDPARAHSSNFSISGGNFNSAGGDLNILNEDAEKGLLILFQSTSPSAAYDAGARYPPPLCHPGTREAVLRDLDSWANFKNAEDRSSIRWLYGPAGAGKSAIAQTFAQSCAERGTLAASYFFWRQDSTRNNPQRLFTTIALQMGISIPALRPFINAAILKNPMAVTSSIEKQSDMLIIQPWLTSRMTRKGEDSTQPTQPHVLIIDGLDECSDSHSQQRILSILPMITQKWGSSIRVLVCSRPEPRIKESFLSLDVGDVCQWMPLDETYKASSDIRLMLVDGFADILKRHSLTMQHIRRPWPTDQQIEYLIKKSSGQFIYASTVLKYLDADGDVPAERLNIVLGISVEDQEGRDAPYTELDALYHQILSTVKNRVLMLRVLAAWMVFEEVENTDMISRMNHRPRFSAMGHAIETQPEWFDKFVELLSIPLGVLQATFSSLHSLFQGPSPLESHLKFSHASLTDFLLAKDRSLHFHISLPKGHDYLAQCYLAKSGDPKVPYTLRSYPSNKWCYHSVLGSGSDKLLAELESFPLYAAISREVEPSYSWPGQLASCLAHIHQFWTKFQHRHRLVVQQNFQHLCTVGFILVVSDDTRRGTIFRTKIPVQYSSSSVLVEGTYEDCRVSLCVLLQTLRDGFPNPAWVGFVEILPLP
ncbi:hypothetical protein D9757_012137 [Collybiopsis confluens]|uniref:Nephrocystin 3-like N-terminal domain-containing protein n=1 Tax=Collybiopsis confluens TaxID=2823264 RepID=A0A8H5GHW9_9AGAR|nr:hypothetical protein D9757_012137 [Collybiopsis confluens]